VAVLSTFGCGSDGGGDGSESDPRNAAEAFLGDTDVETPGFDFATIDQLALSLEVVGPKANPERDVDVELQVDTGQGFVALHRGLTSIDGRLEIESPVPAAAQEIRAVLHKPFFETTVYVFSARELEVGRALVTLALAP
jgi:hypothetical protein